VKIFSEGYISLSFIYPKGKNIEKKLMEGSTDVGIEV